MLVLIFLALISLSFSTEINFNNVGDSCDCCRCDCDDATDVTMANFNYHATRDYPSSITGSNVYKLHVDWNVTLCGSSISPPSIVDNVVWSGDFGGCLTTLKFRNGNIIDRKNISVDYNLPNKIYARVTPTHDYEYGLVVTVTNGIIGNRTGFGTWVIAVDSATMNEVWKTKISDSIWTVGTASPLIKDGFVYVGLSSSETGGPLIPGYVCCQTVGKFYELRLQTGQLTQVTPMFPDSLSGVGKYSGGMIWGQMIIARGYAFVPTGQMYQIPASAAACVNASAPIDQLACIDPRVNFNSVVKIKLARGKFGGGGIVDAVRTFDVDVWNVACFLIGSGIPGCQLPLNAFDYDVSGIMYSKEQDMIVAYTKAGFVITYDFDLNFMKLAILNNTGSVFGGFIGAAALRDHKDKSKMRMVFANTNGNYSAFVLPNGTTIYSGVWVCYDGNLNMRWITPVPGVGLTPQTLNKTAADVAYGGVSITNDIVMAFSRYGGDATFMDLETGVIIRQIPIGGSMSGSCSIYGDSIICPTGPGGNPLSPLQTPTSPGPVATATSPRRTAINLWNLIKFEL